jgi:hypothetical protein
MALGLLVWSGHLQAFSPPEMNCPSGCSCDALGTQVDVYCDTEPDLVCTEIEEACDQYCADYEDYLITELNITWASCFTYNLTENCWPLGLEAPTETTCNCICWY